jgi:DNA-binding IclR family transcriptional regulator
VETQPLSTDPAQTPAVEAGVHAAYTSTRRAFRIIDRVSRGGEGLVVKQLAHELHISDSTCYHLLSLLIDEGYVERLPHQGGYRLGPSIEVLHARADQTGPRGVVDPVLRELARRTNATAYYAVLGKNEDVVIANAYSAPDSMPVGVPEGFRGPAHALALGKILIAAGGVAAIDSYIRNHRLEPFTRRTITDPARLEAHLKEARARGFATDFEEFARNLHCVAVAVVPPGGGPAAGAIGVSTNAGRTVAEVKQLIRLAQHAAEQVSAAL